MRMKSNKKSSDTSELQFLKEAVSLRRVSAKEIESFANIDYPLFSFRWLSDVSFGNSVDAKFFVSYLNRLQKLSELGWEEIRKSDRHSYGMESIPVDAIKIKKLPKIVTPDVKNLHVFRASGDNRPMIGLQQGKIFHVLFIEASFGDIYNH